MELKFRKSKLAPNDKTGTFIPSGICQNEKFYKNLQTTILGARTEGNTFKMGQENRKRIWEREGLWRTRETKGIRKLLNNGNRQYKRAGQLVGV